MNAKQLNLLTSIGAGLEYYDFIIYAMLASYLSHLFFPTNDTISGLVKLFAVFAIAYLVRPIGGFIFGAIGDRFGRKRTFLTAILLMAFATGSIGLLPTYNQIGMIATLLLIGLRTLQGLAFGAEMPGAITFLCEHVTQKRRGSHIGFMVCAVGFGAALGSLVNYLLTLSLSTQTILDWGWRIPFWLGGLLGIVGFTLRKKAQETPFFLQLAKQNLNQQPVSLLFSQYRKQIIQGVGITLFSACLIIFVLFLPSFLHTYYYYPMHSIFLMITIGLLWSSLLLPLFGWISDLIGRKNLLLTTALFVLVFGYFLFQLPNYHSNRALLVFMLIYETLTSALAVCYMTMLAELFPTPVRYIGVGVCYNLAFSMAGLLPLCASFILQLTHKPFYVTTLLTLLAATTTIACISLNDRTQQRLA